MAEVACYLPKYPKRKNLPFFIFTELSYHQVKCIFPFKQKSTGPLDGCSYTQVKRPIGGHICHRKLIHGYNRHLTNCQEFLNQEAEHCPQETVKRHNWAVTIYQPARTTGNYFSLPSLNGHDSISVINPSRWWNPS